jgi:tRNA A-37 threonylcarbamoyl transferase component Bud32
LLAESPGADQTELIAHLDRCAACQRTLETLAGADRALLDAASALSRTAYLGEPSLQRLLVDLETDASLTALYHPADRTAGLQALLRPPESPDTLGQLDSYRVSELLGQGAMGLVLKAFDPALKRWVAIKVQAPDLARDRVARQRFAREAQAAAAVHHPHVVTIHAVSEANGVPYFVMDYLAGGSLQDYLDRHGQLEWSTVARLGAEIASGLAAAHARGLVHRDIKPSNVLLGMEGSPGEPGPAKIGDFGLVRVADEARLTQTGTVTGTPMYMSPEQARCEPLDHRADLFSLGSLLYVLCTGREPFPAGSPIAVLRQVCEATPRPIRELNPAIPPWLAAIVERLHAKHPGDRFASAAEVAELLRYNLEHPEQPRPVPAPGAGRWMSRRTRRLAVAALLAGLLLLGAFGLSEALHWTHLTGWGGYDGTQANGVRLRTTLQRHKGTVWSVAYAPDGRTLATGEDDQVVRLWDAVTGEEKGDLPGHSGAVVAVAFAHSGNFLISGDSDGTLHVWDLATAQELPPLPHHSGNVRRIAISPDDRTVAVSSSAQGVELWDFATRTVRLTLAGHQSSILAIAFAPDGGSLATGDASGDIRLWSPADGMELASLHSDPFSVRALAFAPDSQTLAAAGTGDKDVKLWSIATREHLATLSGSENGVQIVAIVPDGRILATGSRDGLVRFWDLHSAQLLATVHAHQGSVLGLAFAPDSRTLATVGEDRLGKLWDLGSLLDARP